MNLVAAWLSLLLYSFFLRSVLSASTVYVCNDCGRRTKEINDDSDRFWTDYQEKCGPESFELYLSIGVHFAFYAEPSGDRAPPDCPPIWLHADSSSETGKVKDVYPVNREELAPHFSENSTLSFGAFPLQDIARAFNAIDVNAAGEQQYNIVTNNCAVLVLGMVRALGIQTTHEDRRRVVEGLVAADKKANNKLAEYVRSSGEVERSLGLTREATNEQLLERLTLRQISLALDGVPSSDMDQSSVPDGMLPHTSAEGNRELLIQGVPTNGQEFPFFVQSATSDPSFTFPDIVMCGAVLVAPDVILTAATCYIQFKWSRSVLVGSTNLSTADSLSEWRSITSDILVHPLYDGYRSSNVTYDFALMKIEAVTLPNLIPAALNTLPGYPVANQKLTIVGYGNTKESDEYNPSQKLRKVNVTTYSGRRCRNFGVDTSMAFCAYTTRSGPCYGDYGGPVLDNNGTVVALARYTSGACANKDGSPNSYIRLSVGIDWIRQTICSLSDFSGNYSFCPSVICPAPLNLLGEPNAMFPNGASVPSVTGAMLKPAQDNVTQIPAPGTPIRPGKSKVVRVTTTDSSHRNVTCNWTVSVPPVISQLYLSFRARKGNTTKVKPYSLDVPFTGNFVSLDAELSFKIERTKNAVVDLTFRRVNRLNASDSTVLQSFTVTGNMTYWQTFNATVSVAVPDTSSYLYVAHFTSRGVKKAGDVYYYLVGQVKKM